jgi:hypothetical protein
MKLDQPTSAEFPSALRYEGPRPIAFVLKCKDEEEPLRGQRSHKEGKKGHQSLIQVKGTRKKGRSPHRYQPGNNTFTSTKGEDSPPLSFFSSIAAEFGRKILIVNQNVGEQSAPFGLRLLVVSPGAPLSFP